MRGWEWSGGEERGKERRGGGGGLRRGEEGRGRESLTSNKGPINLMKSVIGAGEGEGVP